MSSRKIEIYGNVITDISLEINKIVTSGFGNLRPRIEGLVLGRTPVTQRNCRTSLFERLCWKASPTYPLNGTLKFEIKMVSG